MEAQLLLQKEIPLFLIPTDIKGITRTLPPDLGAYQSNTFVN